MITKEQIEKISSEHINQAGLFLVDIQVKKGNVIEVFVDKDTQITIAECVALSRIIEHSFDREKEDFELLVSSPGLEHPLKIPRQYLKNIGRELTVVGKDGKKTVGLLKEANDETFTIENTRKEKVEGKKKKQEITESITFNYSEIKEAKINIQFK